MTKTLKKASTKLLDWEEDFIEWMHLPKEISTRSLKNQSKIVRYNQTIYYYYRMLVKYAALQTADLYAHFSPVSHILHPFLLSDFPDDQYGKTSILDRIKKAGENIFYRVEYEENEEDSNTELTEEQKREKEKKYVEDSKTKKRLIDTAIADTEYINNVIEAYVHKKKEYESKLYDEEQHKH